MRAARTNTVMMRTIDVQKIEKTVADLCIEANIAAPKDLRRMLTGALRKEQSPIGREVLGLLIENLKIAGRDALPICQDTGMAVVFLEIGQDVHVQGGDLYAAIHRGVREGYARGYLRKSVVDPLCRKNTMDNTPAVIHADIVPGNKLTVTVSPKGFGSENMSAVRMFNPTAAVKDVQDFIVDCVLQAGARPCPPLVVGVGIGGTFETAALLAKKALLKPLVGKDPDKKLADLEKVLLQKINKLGIGPAGLGGSVTALAVKVLAHPTHIAGLPVAVNICCHALRHASRVI